MPKDTTTEDTQTIGEGDVASLPEGVAPIEDATGDETSVEAFDEDVRFPTAPAGEELVPIRDADVATIEQLLTTMKQTAVADSEEIAARLAAKKLQARSVEELNKMGTLGALADVLNVPVVVSELRWNESRIAGSAGAYAVFDVVNTYTGEVSTIGSGHQDVMITLFKAQQWGLLPCQMVFSQAANPNRFGKPTYLAKILPPEPVAG
jgi:hypothetical protein